MSRLLHHTARWSKRGFIYKPSNEAPWWYDHAMAPSAIWLGGDSIRVYMGGWLKERISRIGYIDVALADPTRIVHLTRTPILDIGRPGTFDDNGVFPAHATRLASGEVRLYYTGFQNSTRPEIDHFNFNGLASSQDGHTFEKISQCPILDRADEGLFVRAGLSVCETQGGFECVYSAGSLFSPQGGKLRPSYEVFYQHSQDGISFAKSGTRIVAMDHSIEHGLGRPQLIRLGDVWYCFYTRRTLDMRYHMGCAYSLDLKSWTRSDDWLATLVHGQEGEFDSQMVYFPSVVVAGDRILLFYCGNGYGTDGFGYAELEGFERSSLR